MRRDALAVLGALLVVAAAAWGDDADVLAEHRELWRNAALESYEYRYLKFCECTPETPPETRVSVRDGTVVDVRHQPHGYERLIGADPRDFQWYWTIEQLFELVDSGLERGAEVRVEYDAALGFPTRLYIDRDADRIGDEIDLRLTRVEPLAER